MISSAVPVEEVMGTYPAAAAEVAGVRQMAAERLAAHRNRRALLDDRAAQAAVRQQARRAAARQVAAPDGAEIASAVAGARRVRDAVAARYQQSQSYREFLAIEAQRALERAQAEADVAARSAQAVVAAQRKLLEEIEQWNQPDAEAEAPPLLQVVPPRTAKARKEIAATAPVQLQVKLHEELEMASREVTALSPAAAQADALEEMASLDEEIEFRFDPAFEEMVLETTPIHGNLIAFPRELVASRKVRPRLAEGPLLEDVAPQPQLRIFEVEPELLEAASEPVTGPAAAEWQSLRLGAEMSVPVREQTQSQLDASDYFDHWLEPVTHAAPVSRRLTAGLLDMAVVGAGLAGAIAVAGKLAGGMEGMPLPPLAGAAAAGAGVFALLYRVLFFTLNEATPGMRLTRLAFCTFEEASPARSAVRKRLFATLLAAAPLGMGLLWALLDGERLGWHDRMSRMYLRKYE